VVCNRPTRFINSLIGYAKYCSRSCSATVSGKLGASAMHKKYPNLSKETMTKTKLEHKEKLSKWASNAGKSCHLKHPNHAKEWNRKVREKYKDKLTEWAIKGGNEAARVNKDNKAGCYFNSEISKIIGVKGRKTLNDFHKRTGFQSLSEIEFYNYFKPIYKDLEYNKYHIFEGKRLRPDFTIESKKLIIEIDGSYHDSEEQKFKDLEKELYFDIMGYKVLRFKNEDLKQDMISINKKLNLI